MERKSVSSKKEKVLIFGGSGFIGSYCTKKLLQEGYHVIVASIDKDVKKNDYLKGSKLIYLDLYKSSDSYIRKIMKGIDYVLFLAGADDRCIPKAPALEFFRRANVDTAKRIVKIAKEMRVKKILIASSYFAHFARKNPEWQLEKVHPYIQSRCEQEDSALRESSKDFSVIVLQLPYVIGAIEGKAPLFKPLVRYINSSIPTLFMRGGTAIVSVQQVADGVFNCIRREIDSGRYPFVAKNLTWNEFIWKINPTKKVIHIPLCCLRVIGALIDFVNFLRGREAGLRMREFVKLQVKELFLNIDDCTVFFENSEEIVDSAFEDMIRES